MADRTIRAEAIISAKDETGPAFTSVAGHFKALGQAAGHSASVDALAKSLKSVQSQMQAIERFRSATRGLKDSSNGYKAAAQEAKALRAALAGIEKPTKDMQRQLAMAEREADRLGQAFKRQGAMAREARSALESIGVPISQLASKQEHLKGVLTSTTRAIEQQVAAERRAASAHAATEKALERRSEGARHHGIVNYALGAAAGYVGAHGVMTGIERTIEAGSEYQHEIIGLQNAGRTPAEIEAIRRRSTQVTGRLPTASYIENMKVVAETTPAFGSVEHAMDNLEFMQKAMSILKAAGGEHIKGGAGDVGRALAKTFEERFTKAENFQNEASQMIPAMVASGGVFNPEQLYAFAQQAKSALPNYSMRFLSRIAPSLIGAQGGERAGTAANAFNSIVMGKVNDKKQAEAWEKFGLLDETKVIKKAGNVVSWSAGAVKGTDLAMSDPLRWAEEVALPAMIAKGVPVMERLALAKELATMFRNQNGNMFANEIMQADSRARLHKDEGLTNRVGDMNTIYNRNMRDPRVAFGALKTSLENLMTTVSSPMMGRASAGLSGLSSNINALANMMQNHPELAAATGVGLAGGGLLAAGTMASGLMNGFGLGASATALDSSAVALHGAAAALDGAAIKSGIGAGMLGLGKGAALEAATLEATIAGEGTLALAGAVSIGTLAISGLAAVAVIGALSQGKKKLAADDPGFGDPFGKPFEMPGSIDQRSWLGKIAGATPLGGGGRGRAPASGNQRPFHMVQGRGGVWEKVYDPMVTPFHGDAPMFAKGIYSPSTFDGTLGYVEGRQGRRLAPFPMGRIGDAPGRGSMIGAPPLSNATGFGPIDVTGKVDAEIKGQATVNVNVRVDGGGEVTGQYASSTGNIRASVGTSGLVSKQASNGRVSGPN